MQKTEHDNGSTTMFSQFVGTGKAMRAVYTLIDQLLDNDSTVLILGESGTGKELVARTIHYYGDRKHKPIVTVNCAAIPEDLLESELFGHEQGAFTGASRTRIGKFEIANRGTIFLDEIGDMSPALQVKMLRVLQQQEFDRVGGMKPIKVDVRIVAATNKDLDKAVDSGNFREDLYYRLNVIQVKLPPLRNRKEDIPFLANHFVDKFNKSKRRNITGITEEAMASMVKYNWKGNIRELENAIERAVILKRKGKVSLNDLPEKISGLEYPPMDGFDESIVEGCGESDTNHTSLSPHIEISEHGINLKEVVEEFENNLIVQALRKTGWVKGKAADLLGINRTTLVEKLKKKGIKEE